MATKAVIRQRVGEDLALVPIGQDLESQDQARIDQTYDEVYELLKDRGLATWPSTAEVPTKVVPHFVLLMEEKLLNSYGVPDSRYQRIKADAGPDGSLALTALAEAIVPPYVSNTSASDF